MKPNPFNALNINDMYKRCLWKQGELDNMRVAVISGYGKEHIFHHRKIDRMKRRIGHMLLNNMRSDMMRSEGSGGRPWMLMRTDRQGLPMGMMESVDKLFCLAQACGFLSVRIDSVDGLDQPMPFVIVEDVRIRNWLKKEEHRYGK